MVNNITASENEQRPVRVAEDVLGPVPRKLLLELRRRATGGGSFMACRHPDIDGSAPRKPTEPDRQCVLDRNAPEDCEFSSQSSIRYGGTPVTAKRACPCWQRLTRAEPAGCSPEETLTLVRALLGSA